MRLSLLVTFFLKSKTDQRFVRWFFWKFAISHFLMLQKRIPSTFNTFTCCCLNAHSQNNKKMSEKQSKTSNNSIALCEGNYQRMYHAASLVTSRNWQSICTTGSSSTAFEIGWSNVLKKSAVRDAIIVARSKQKHSQITETKNQKSNSAGGNYCLLPTQHWDAPMVIKSIFV